jgi:hypothetical protein
VEVGEVGDEPLEALDLASERRRVVSSRSKTPSSSAST